jgi:Tfp pilus assembly protein PilN
MFDKRMVNLLPQDKEVKILDFKKLDFKKSKFVFIALGVILIMIIMQIIQGVAVRSYSTRLSLENKQLNDAFAKLRKMKGVSVKLKTPLDTLEKAKEEFAAKVSFLQKYFYDKTPWDAVLAELQAVLPKGVWLNDLNFEESSVSFKCSASNSNLISEFMAKLNHSTFFKEAKLNFSEKIKENGSESVNFEINCLIEKQKD